MRNAIVIISWFILVCMGQLFAQDSCGCANMRPLPDHFGVGQLIKENYSTYQLNGKPYTGICHNYYMKVAYKIPDTSRTLEYAQFKEGKLLYYVRFNERKDTYAVFRRVNVDSMIAEERRFDYRTGLPQSKAIYYYSSGKKLILWSDINPAGGYFSASHFFYPPKGDSLRYYATSHNYLKESVLQNDGFYNIPVHEGEYCEYALKDSLLLTKGYYHNNYRSGHWTEWYPNGQMKSDGDYALAYEWKYGEWKEWYANGQLKSDIEYCNSNPCGKYMEWYENGQLKKSVQYVKVPTAKGFTIRSTGDLIEYYASGQMKHRAHFEETQTTDETWYENGQQETFISYGKNQVNRKWFENGQLRSEENYHDGKPSVPWREYYDNGKLKHYVEYESYATRNGKEEYYFENGQLMSSAYFEHGKQMGKSRTYYPNGKQKSEEEFIGIRTGPAKYWDENGTLRSQINWMNQQWDGECTFYYPDGKLWRKGKYKAGVREGQFREWNESGEMIYSQTYLEGIPQLKVKYHSPADLDNDSLRKAFREDAPKLACSFLIDPESPFNHLILPTDSLNKVALEDLMAVAAFSLLDQDSARFVHFDSSAITWVYLDYPWYPKRNGDTSRCASTGSWPPALDKTIENYQFKPVFDECYGDDHGGIRRGFTSALYLNGSALDSALKKMNPKFGCETFRPTTRNMNDDFTRITGFAGKGASCLYYYHFPYNDQRRNYYLEYTFMVYPDHSVDMIEELHTYFFYYFPE